MFVSVIIAAAGKGKRMKAERNKQYLYLEDRPILVHTVSVFERCKEVDEIIIVTGEKEVEFCYNEIVKKYSFKKVVKVIAGGLERQDSVYAGILALSPQCEIVMVHDGARPFVTKAQVLKSIEAAQRYTAVGIGVPVKDTIKVVDDQGMIKDTPDRKTLWAMQTPQTFTYSVLRKAYESALQGGFVGTDDTGLVERIGIPVKMLEGTYENIKITTPEDIYIAKVILSNLKGE